jgi:hypothetical protein
MVAFVAGSRLSCAGFASYLVTPIPDVGAFVIRSERSLRVHAPGAEIAVPDSGDAEVVAVSPAGTMAWSTRAHAVKRWSAAGGVVAMRDGRFVRTWVLAVADSGVVVAGGYEWTEKHEEHAHALAVYEGGMPYDYGEYRPPVPPQPAFEPGLAAVWSDPKSPPRTLLFAKAVSRVALDVEGDAFGAWSDDGHVITSSWNERWFDGGGTVLAAALGPDGEEAAWVHPTGIYVRDKARGVRRLVGFEPREAGAAAISLARRLVAHAREGVIRFFSLESGALVGTTAMNEGIEALAFTEDGDGLAVVTGGAVVTGRVS